MSLVLQSSRPKGLTVKTYGFGIQEPVHFYVFGETLAEMSVSDFLAIAKLVFDPKAKHRQVEPGFSPPRFGFIPMDE